MTKKQPLVSVIMAAYNHEKYIQETITSIINQTYKNIEFLVLDDGSPDSTWKKILQMKEKCQKRFSHIDFQTKENEGTCKTYNKLLSKAKGEFIFFIDSDDRARPEEIEIEVDFLSSHPEYALCVGDNEIIDSDGRLCYWDKDRNNIYDKTKAAYLSFGDFLKASRPVFNESFGTYSTLYIGNYVPNGYMFRRSILKKIGKFTPQAPLEDWWLVLQISKYAKLKYIDKKIHFYRWHGANTVKNIQKMTIMGDKTKQYELDLLNRIDFSTVSSDVRLCFIKEKMRQFRHKYLYHKTKINDRIVIKLFGFIKIK